MTYFGDATIKLDLSGYKDKLDSAQGLITQTNGGELILKNLYFFTSNEDDIEIGHVIRIRGDLQTMTTIENIYVDNFWPEQFTNYEGTYSTFLGTEFSEDNIG